MEDLRYEYLGKFFNNAMLCLLPMLYSKNTSISHNKYNKWSWLKGNGRCSSDIWFFLITHILYDLLWDIVTLFSKKKSTKKFVFPKLVTIDFEFPSYDISQLKKKFTFFFFF